MNAPQADFRERYGPFVLVTGASSGIGWAFAEALAVRGMNLVLVARRIERLERLASRLITEHGIAAQVLPVDLARPEAPNEIAEQTVGVDIGLVVSNAGFSMKGDHAGNDAGVLTEMLMVNCHAPLQLTRAFIPRLRARGRGGIIITGSIEGLIGCPYSSAYSSTKALVKALGEGLWAELRPDGIDVLTLCPGATESEAAAKVGLDLSRMSNVMKAADVAQLALANIGDGPNFISSAHYAAQFEQLLAMPRRDALLAMAQAMRPVPPEREIGA